MDLMTLALIKKMSSGGGGDTSSLLKKIEANKASIDEAKSDIQTLQQQLDLRPTKEDLATGKVPVLIQIASGSDIGGGKSSSATNGVSVLSDGTMTVNSVGVDRLVQDDEDYLILDSGSASTF